MKGNERLLLLLQMEHDGTGTGKDTGSVCNHGHCEEKHTPDHKGTGTVVSSQNRLQQEHRVSILACLLAKICNTESAF